MNQLITLEEAQNQVKDFYAENIPDLENLILAASAMVLNYLKSGADGFLDSSGSLIYDSQGVAIGVPPEVKIATRIVLADLYKNREGQSDSKVDAQYGYGYINAAAVAILYPLRDPSLA